MKIILLGTKKELDKFTNKIEQDYRNANYQICDYDKNNYYYEVAIAPKLMMCEIKLEDF